MRRLLPPSLLLIGLSLLASCGGKSGGAGDGDAGGTDAGGSGNSGAGNSSAGKNAGGSSSAGKDSGGSGANAGGGNAALCESFDDDPGYQVAVQITNATDQTIHVGSDMANCSAPPLFEVADDQATLLPALGDCRQPCQVLRTSGGLGCPAICAFPNAITLAPGEATTTIWSGLFGGLAELPKSCMPLGREYEPRTCDQARQIEPGTYTFSARAGTSLDCDQTTGGPCGACMPSGAGGCSTPAVIAGERLTAETTVDLDASYGVVGPSAGEPAPGQKAAPAPIGENLSVEIIFK